MLNSCFQINHRRLFCPNAQDFSLRGEMSFPGSLEKSECPHCLFTGEESGTPNLSDFLFPIFQMCGKILFKMDSYPFIFIFLVREWITGMVP